MTGGVVAHARFDVFDEARERQHGVGHDVAVVARVDRRGLPVVGDDVHAEQAAHAHHEGGAIRVLWPVGADQHVSGEAGAVGVRDRREVRAPVLLLAVEDDFHRPLRRPRSQGVERAQDVGEMLALVVGAPARHHDDVVERLRVERARVDARTLAEVGGLEWATLDGLPAPSGEVARRLDIVMPVEQEGRRAGGPGELPVERGGATTLVGGERDELDADLAPERADGVHHRPRDLPADRRDAQVTVEEVEAIVTTGHTSGGSIAPMTTPLRRRSACPAVCRAVLDADGAAR